MAKWEVEGEWVYAEKSSNRIAKVTGKTDADAAVNRRLIAAAPDLLAFANAFLAECGDMDDANDQMERICKMAAQAIARAEGKVQA